MPTDPNTRRARNLVLLVLLCVGLPSVFLTGLGIIAIKNEEEVSKKRLEEIYKPVVFGIAKDFNQLIEKIIEQSQQPLEQLVAYKEGEIDHLGREFEEFFQNNLYAVNYFVINRVNSHVYSKRLIDGGSREVLLEAYIESVFDDLEAAGINSKFTKSRRQIHNHIGKKLGELRSIKGILPQEYVQAIQNEKENEVPQNVCQSMVKLTELNHQEDPNGCIARFAAALCQKANGIKNQGHFQLDEIQRECLIIGNGPVIKKSIKLAEIAPERQLNPNQFGVKALDLVRLLSDPQVNSPSVVTELLSRLFALILHDIEPGAYLEVYQAKQSFESMAERAALLEYFANQGRPREGTTTLGAVRVDDWRRVVLIRNIKGTLAGFELIPGGFSPFLNRALGELTNNAGLLAVVIPTSSPDCCKKHNHKKKLAPKKLDWVLASWVLLLKTDLAWEIGIFLIDKKLSTLGRLAQQRSVLYLWGLILIVATMVAGIAYTVRSVVKEAKLSGLKTDFVSSVSHDLRTPLTSIRMFTETLMLGRVKDKEEEQEFLQVISFETERLSRLTERILDFSRMEADRKAYTKRPENIKEVVEHAISACRPIMEEANIQPKIDIVDDLPPVEIDRDAIIEVLVNLIANAVKYSPDRKEVSIVAHTNQNFLELSVIDKGIGISKADQKRIFDKFFRVDCRRTTEVGGSGIGLSLVRYIVDAHDGEIRVESTLGKGSAFTVRLPVKG